MENRFPENVRAITKLLRRETVRELYDPVDFVVILSYFKSFDLVHLQATCLGAVPIASAVGGLNDTIIELSSDPEHVTGCSFLQWTPLFWQVR